MSFISPDYVIFFAVVVPLFFWLPHRWRWVLLLIASYYFYSYYNPWYLPLIFITTFANYAAAIGIDRTLSPPRRRVYLALAIIISLGLLFLFKYFNFASRSVSAVTGQPPLVLDLVLPVGISFYTFQAMAYTIDVYRRRLNAETHPGIMATFIAFFPQLVAGPIERATNLLPQFHQQMTFVPARAVEGFRLILWGLFKKVVIADRLAIYANAVYNDVHSYTGLPLILATFFFAFQIYCDFSAYSDIAIGTARVMGFSLMQNFRQPYLARSVREFWARWHISLSTWFRDYLYIPLGGNRISLPRTLLNMFIVFLVSGLWHGAAWTFVVWGAMHGVFVVIEGLMQQRGWKLFPPDAPYKRALQTAGTFALVLTAWVFFRANSFNDALYVLANAPRMNGGDWLAPFDGALLAPALEMMLSFGLIALLLWVDHQADRADGLRLPAVPVALRWAAYYALGAAVMFSGLYGAGAQQFIYFQF